MGVSVAYTVLKCDAGPVLAQQRLPVDPDLQAPELLGRLFSLGTALLLSRLDDVWAGRGQQLAVPQDEALATHAAKVGRSGRLPGGRPGGGGGRQARRALCTRLRSRGGSGGRQPCCCASALCVPCPPPPTLGEGRGGASKAACARRARHHQAAQQ
jgi:hypothetical protein